MKYLETSDIHVFMQPPALWDTNLNEDHILTLRLGQRVQNSYWEHNLQKISFIMKKLQKNQVRNL